MLNSKTSNKLLIIEYELNNSLIKKISKDLNNYHIVTLCNDFDNQNLINKFNISRSNSFGGKDIEDLVDNEASLVSRKWMSLVRDRNNDFPFIYKNIDLSIPIIHTMGVGLYPETFFHSLIRGYRYAEKIIKSINPDKVIIVDSNSPVILGFKLAAYKTNHKKDYSISCIRNHKIKIIINNIYLSMIKPLLQISRDIYYALKNIIFFTKKNKIENKRILFFPLFYNRIRLVESVLTELTRRNIETKLVLNNKGKHKISSKHKANNSKRLKEAIKKIKLKNSFFNDFLNFQIIYRLIKMRLLISNNNIKSFEYESNDDILLIVNKTYLEAYKHFIYNYYYGILRTVEILYRIIEVELPKLLLFNTDEAIIGKLAALIGQEKNIPVVNMDHALQYDSPRISDLLFTKMAVSGLYNKELFIKNNAKEKQIEITGMPIHDKIYRRLNKPNNASYLNELDLDQKIPTILLLTHPYTRTGPNRVREQILKSVFDSVKSLLNANLIIKLHPNETDGLVQNAVNNSKLKNVKIIKKVENLYDVMKFSDMVITSFNSTTAIEAVFFSKPVLILNFTGKTNSLNCASEGVAIEVTEPKKVYGFIKNILSNKKLLSELRNNRPKFIERYAYKLDGKSTIRMSDLIEGLIRKE